MNIYQECFIGTFMPNVRLFITCPKHYLIDNYESWFKPESKSYEDFYEVEAHDLRKNNIIRSLSKIVENPNPYLDLLYNDSCLVDLICTPVMFNRFIDLVDDLQNIKPINGYTIFKFILDDAFRKIRWNGVRKTLFKEFVGYIKEMALNQLLRNQRNHRVLSY